MKAGGELLLDNHIVIARMIKVRGWGKRREGEGLGVKARVRG